ncbi:MAG: hypothetical protein ACSHUF_00020 [Candidatus Nasuia deltocephalinicola]
MNIFFFEKLKILIKILKYNSIFIMNYIYFFSFIKKFYINKILKLKFGIDPTSKNIHAGHVFYFLKILSLKNLKFLKIIIIIGLETSLINNSYNLKKYITNSKYILYYINYISIFKNIKILKYYYNTEWIKIINLKEINFLKKNFKNNFLNLDKNKKLKNYQNYLTIQSYDSIFINSSVEMGGGDQKYNFLVCYNFLLYFIKKIQIYYLYPILFKNNFLKISKSSKDIFFNLFYLKNIILKLKKKKYLKFYFKLLLYLDDFYINYIIINSKSIIIKEEYILKNINKKFFKKYFFLNTYKVKINILKKKSLIFFKIFKIIFMKKFFKTNKIFYIFFNNLKIKNKNFIFFKGNYKILLNKKNKNLKII